MRLLTAIVVLPILIASILVSWLQPLFVFLAATAMILALYEFWLLAKKRDLKPDVTAGYIASAAIFTVLYFNELGQPPDVLTINLIIIALTAGVLIAATLRGTAFEKMIPSAGATILGVLYVVLLGGHLVAVRVSFQPELAADLLSFFFLILMGADSGAYYAGRAFGKHKLAPNISPGKSFEGVAGGLVVAVAFAVLAHFWFFRELPLKWAVPLAVTMTVLGIFGDLVESALKRGAGAKDAAQILPGHGGLLDRLDSLLFNAPVIYYFGRVYF